MIWKFAKPLSTAEFVASKQPPSTPVSINQNKENLIKTANKLNITKGAEEISTGNVVTSRNVAKSNELAMFENLVSHKPWTHVLTHMKMFFSKKGLETSLIDTFTLNHYFKKVNI